MANYIDLYLGAFLVLSGFGISLLNLRRIVKGGSKSFSMVLLSENILLTCIGMAFISRSIYELSPLNTEMNDIEKRSEDIMKNEEMNCDFSAILMSYGPLVVSLVNSFLSLVIDNYMHYKMIADVKRDEEESTVRALSDNFRGGRRMTLKDLFTFVKKYFTFIIVVLQWIIPALLTLSMYSIDVKQMTMMDASRSFGHSCMALIDVTKQNCSIMLNETDPAQLREYIQNKNYLEMYEFDSNNISDKKIDSVVDNVFKILANLQNETHYADINVSSTVLRRNPKQNLEHKCMKICFLDNKNLLLYMFAVAVVSYFVPITISTIILTKIHVMGVKNHTVKTYVNRELFYNILFWTPVMFDTFLSITLCSYSMSGMRTSIFNVMANVYQAVKNFMNTKYFKDNIVVPV